MDPQFFVTNALVPFTSALAGNVGGNLLKPVLTIYDNWFYKTFGSKSELERKKLELKNQNELSIYEYELEQEKNIGLFKKEILQNLLQIEDDNIVLPDKHIVSLIMDNAKLYLEIDDIRNYFAKILAGTANKTLHNNIHPLHIETIKQLTSKEAKILKKINSHLGLQFKVITNFYSKSFAKPKDNRYFQISLDADFPTFNMYVDTPDIDSIPHINNPSIFSMDTNKAHNSLEILTKLNIISEFSLTQYDAVGIYNSEMLKEVISEIIRDVTYYSKYEKELNEHFDDVFSKIKIKVYQLTDFGAALVNLVENKQSILLPTSMNESSFKVVPTDAHIEPYESL